jgi:V/A-type H+/Na+-transporting ATPase subunit D
VSGPVATRSNVLRLRRRLEQVDKGAALLRRKREALVAELFARARPAIEAREGIENQGRIAWAAILAAHASHGRDELSTLGWPARELRIELAPIEVWGVQAWVLERKPEVVRTPGARGTAPGPDGAAPTEAAQAFEELVDRLIDAAPHEFLMVRLGHELAKATRLVNTLEQRVATGLRRDLTAVRRTLEEREREEHLRLVHVIARRRR